MRILHICEYVQGGVATYIRTLLHHDGEQNVYNYLVLSNEKSTHDWPIKQERIFYYYYQRGLVSIYPAMQVIRKIVEKVRPDVIYCYSTWAGVLGRFPLIFKCRRYTRVIYNAHGWAFYVIVQNGKGVFMQV